MMLSRVPLIARGFAAAGRASEGGGGSPITDALFQSDWQGRNTGTASIDLSDGNLWTEIGNGSSTGAALVDRMEIVSAAGLGFPAGLENVFAAKAPNGDSYAQLWVGPNDPNLPAWSDGDHRYYRYYRRFVLPDGLGDNGFHDFESTGAGFFAGEIYNSPFNAGGGATPSGQFIHWYALNGSDRYYLGDEVDPIYLLRDHTYRIELHMQRLSSTTMIFEPYVYDDVVSTTVPLYGPADFHRNIGARESLADDPVVGYTDGDEVRSLKVGNNGVNHGSSNAVFGYFGCIMVRAAGMCGPWINGESMGA